MIASFIAPHESPTKAFFGLICNISQFQHNGTFISIRRGKTVNFHCLNEDI